MGTRGPKPGWKAQAKTPAAAAAPEGEQALVAIVATQPAPPAAEPERMTAADLANPAKLSGEALRKLAHNRGMSRSEMERMDDAKVRTQLKYLTYRQYEAA
jgi:hypothetical protein